MGRSRGNDRPTVDRVEKIALSEDRVKLRAAAVILLVIVAAAAFAYGVNGLLGVEAGLQEIEAVTGEMNSGGDFTFYYDLGAGETSAADERRAVRALYTQAVTDAFQIFSADLAFEGRKNLWYLNRHVNETVTVDPALYEALALLEESGLRYHYLAPMYELYFSLFQCGEDQEAAEFDPWQNEDLRQFYRETAAFVNDPGAVKVELLGDNTVCLRVSREYLDFAEANRIGRFVDLFWMENAFIADYIADTLVENGFTRGALFSDDGFARCLGGDAEYTVTFTHREGNVVSNAGTLTLSGAVSMVYLRDHPVDNGGGSNYYVYEDGTIRSPYVDTADGLDRPAAPGLAVRSHRLSCAEAALLAAPLYIAEALDTAALEDLAGEGIEFYYCQGGAPRSAGGL